MKKHFLLCLAVAFMIAGCSDQKDADRDEQEKNVENKVNSNTEKPIGNKQQSEMEKSLSLKNQMSADTDNLGEKTESVYTILNLSACEVLKLDEENGGRLMKCEGYNNVPLYIKEGDGRHHVAVGQNNDDFISGKGLNSLGPKIEWRLVKSEPIAAIVQYNFTDKDGSEKPALSELAVISVGDSDHKSCYVDWISQNAKPSQLQKAREVADQKARGFDC